MGFLNNNNRRLDRSLAVADVSHRLVVSYTWDLPFGKDRRFLKGLGPANLLVSGWQFSGVYTAQSGTPIAVGTRTNLSGALMMLPAFTGLTPVTRGRIITDIALSWTPRPRPA